jgi:hypothetical protein
MAPSASIAGYHASAMLSVSTASRIAASIAQPSENPTLTRRHSAANPWVRPRSPNGSGLWRSRVIRARAVLRWERIQCLVKHGDVISGGVTADVARAGWRPVELALTRSLKPDDWSTKRGSCTSSDAPC